MKNRSTYRLRMLLLALIGISFIGAVLITGRWTRIYLRDYNKTLILHDIMPSIFHNSSNLSMISSEEPTLSRTSKWSQKSFSTRSLQVNLTSTTAKLTPQNDNKDTTFKNNVKEENTRSLQVNLTSTTAKLTPQNDNKDTTFKNNVKVENKVKIILHYNPPGWMTFSSRDSFDSCEYKNCKFSTDRSDFEISDAVVFTGTRLPEKPKKVKDQIWIYENIESPVHTMVPSERWRNDINWTLTYRRDSDFVAPYRFVVKGASLKFGKSLDISEIFRNKTNSTAWFVSNCVTSSRRENYVNALKAHTDIDVYGNCGSLRCIGGEECRQMLTEKYKFYIAFENSFCQDYITEKALVNLRQIVIPIVRGSAYYDLYMPPKSFIDARKYSSKKSLALYMKVLANNLTLYNQYQKWHKYYHIQEDHMFHDSLVTCKLCKHLNNPQKYPRVYEDIHDWWHGNENKTMCEKSGES